MEDLTGRQFGPYQIVAPLGEGGMAAVYKAYQPAMERYVALKVLPRQFASDPQFVARFQREAKLLAQLQHPHILPVFDFGEAEGYTYLVMPFVSSGTLTDQLKGQPLPLPRLKQIVAQIGEALDYAHARGLVHRDVKPSNVLLDERGNCLLTDFGLARMVETSVNLTTSGTIMGTPVYMSPEQGSGQPIDGRSDIYSLGVILYELATGRVPYKAETPIAVIFKHIQDPLPPARSLNPALPESLERVILKALAKGPEDRYQTAGEMVRALRAALPDTLLEAAPQTEAFVAGETLRHAPPSPAPGRAPAAPRPLWQAILIAALGWIVGVPLGLLFASIFIPLGGLVAGALGGASIAWGWRRIEPSLARSQILKLAGLWAVIGAIAVVTGPVFVVFLAIGGALTAWRMRRVQPAMTVRDIAIVGLGWGLIWLAGAVMFAIGTQVNPRWLSGVIVILATGLTTGLSNWITFRQYRAARDRTLAPVARAKSIIPRWAYVAAALVILICLAAVAILAGRAANEPAANDRAATSTNASLPAALPTQTRAAPTLAPSATHVPPSPTRPAPTATRLPSTRTPVPPSPTRVLPTRTRVSPTATAAGTEVANWRVDFTLAFPPNSWSVGAHQYTLTSVCAVIQDANKSWTLSFDVSDTATERPGDIFLRLSGLRSEGQPISVIHPAEATVAQLSQIEITRAEAERIAVECSVTISRDSRPAETLIPSKPYQQ